MRKDSSAQGLINCQIYLDAAKVALVREVCLTATGGLLVRGSIPASCILGITEVYPDAERPGCLCESPVWDCSLLYCIPWQLRHPEEDGQILEVTPFPRQPEEPDFTRGPPWVRCS